MASIEIPPKDPPKVVDQRGPSPSVRFRMWQVFLATVTVLTAAWFWTWGPLPGLIFSFLAKHILVGIVTAGMHYPTREHPQA